MRKSSTILAAVAVAGLAVAGGTAFTGTGVINNAGATQFVGGTVNQSVTGATLSSVVYSFGEYRRSLGSADLRRCEQRRKDPHRRIHWR